MAFRGTVPAGLSTAQHSLASRSCAAKHSEEVAPGRGAVNRFRPTGTGRYRPVWMRSTSCFTVGTKPFE